MKMDTTIIGQLALQLSEKDDHQAFRRLHDMVSPSMADFALGYVKSPLVADEIVAEIMAKLWVNRKHLSAIENLPAYLFKSVKNEAMKFLEREKSRPFVSIELHTEAISDRFAVNSPLDDLLVRELTIVLEKSVANLPPHCQEVFRLVKTSGLKYREVAEILGLSVNTVENHMGKALKIIRTDLAHYLSEKGDASGKEIENIASLLILIVFAEFFQNFLQ